MAEKRNIQKQGFTLVELIVAVAMVVIVILGVAVVLVNSQRAYEVTYEKVYADVATDAFFARRLFDSIIRKSSTDDIVLDENGEFVEVHYYSDGSATYLDRYALFFTSGQELKVEHGILTDDGTKEALTEITVCGNVASCKFSQSGGSLRMVLHLDDERRSNLVVTSAHMHN